MARPTGLSGIAHCHFSSYHEDGRRTLKASRLIWLGVLPFILGALLAMRLGSPPPDKLSLIVAVFSVVAAVLIGLLPIANSILGQTEITRKYDVGESVLAKESITRVQVLQDLHAAVSWAVVLVVAALVICAALLFLVPPFVPPNSRWINGITFFSLVMLYGIMASTAFTFFDVASGIFETMESYAEAIKVRVRNNISTDMGMDVDQSITPGSKISGPADAAEKEKARGDSK
jgi:hypothetical protein